MIFISGKEKELFNLINREQRTDFHVQHACRCGAKLSGNFKCVSLEMDGSSVCFIAVSSGKPKKIIKIIYRLQKRATLAGHNVTYVETC